MKLQYLAPLKFEYINMEVEHIQQLTEDLSGDLDYRFDTLIEIVEHFHIEYNEELKENLKQNLCDKLQDLIYEFESKLGALKHMLAKVR